MMQYFLQPLLFFLFISLVLSNTFSIAQNTDIFEVLDSAGESGKITIIQDSSVYNIMQKQIQINKNNKGIPNRYRIQIFSSSGNKARENAIEFKEEFLENHPEFERAEIYQLYQPPFFKLRVGNYRNKHEALIVYKNLVKYYPNCYIVKSKINFPKLMDE